MSLLLSGSERRLPVWPRVVESSGPLSPKVFSENVIRSPQTQRRNSQRRISGRDGRERAAADQIEILVVVRALERVDHGTSAIFAHAMGSDDVPGAKIFYAGLLARRPFERARIVGLGFRR